MLKRNKLSLTFTNNLRYADDTTFAESEKELKSLKEGERGE